MRIALISCTKDKVNYACPAHKLYSASNLFSLSYQYAKRNADRIYILSAKHGLVQEEQILAPYNQTLKEMSREQQLCWADDVIRKLQQECNLYSDHFIILAGTSYYRDLLHRIPNYSLPLEGMPMGVRMAHLKKLMVAPESSMAVRLHRLFCAMPRYRWDQIHELPFSNGIYILFEKGEHYHGMERIVRVGTHTSPDRLKRRLLDHFVKENHDGSIFRKNIGKAILNAHHDPYLATWIVDTSKPENRHLLDPVKNADTEHRVTKYLRENFTFTVFPVEAKEERLRTEEAIIAVLNQEQDFSPTDRWPGKYSTEREIRESGLWLKQGLDGKPLTEDEYCRLLELCGKHPLAVPAATSMVQKKSAPNPTNSNGCGKYEPLYQFLSRQTASQIILTMPEIEAILGFPLPKSAYTYSMWYNPNGHPHCQAWLRAGYDVANVAQAIKTGLIIFEHQK